MAKYLVFLLISFFPVNAQAYIDPGSGSFMIQMLFASIVGGLFTIKMYFQRIKSYVKKKFNMTESIDNSEISPDDKEKK